MPQLDDLEKELRQGDTDPAHKGYPEPDCRDVVASTRRDFRMRARSIYSDDRSKSSSSSSTDPGTPRFTFVDVRIPEVPPESAKRGAQGPPAGDEVPLRLEPLSAEVLQEKLTPGKPSSGGDDLRSSPSWVTVRQPARVVVDDGDFGPQRRENPPIEVKSSEDFKATSEGNPEPCWQRARSEIMETNEFFPPKVKPERPLIRKVAILDVATTYPGFCELGVAKHEPKGRQKGDSIKRKSPRAAVDDDFKKRKMEDDIQPKSVKVTYLAGKSKQADAVIGPSSWRKGLELAAKELGSMKAADAAIDPKGSKLLKNKVANNENRNADTRITAIYERTERKQTPPDTARSRGSSDKSIDTKISKGSSDKNARIYGAETLQELEERKENLLTTDLNYGSDNFEEVQSSESKSTHIGRQHITYSYLKRKLQKDKEENSKLPAKTRPYDPEDVRKYMKNQRKVRQEELMEQKRSKKMMEEARKKKLQELQERTRKLAAMAAKKKSETNIHKGVELNEINENENDACAPKDAEDATHDNKEDVATEKPMVEVKGHVSPDIEINSIENETNLKSIDASEPVAQSDEPLLTPSPDSEEISILPIESARTQALEVMIETIQQQLADAAKLAPLSVAEHQPRLNQITNIDRNIQRSEAEVQVEISRELGPATDERRHEEISTTLELELKRLENNMHMLDANKLIDTVAPYIAKPEIKIAQAVQETKAVSEVENAPKSKKSSRENSSVSLIETQPKVSVQSQLMTTTFPTPKRPGYGHISQKNREIGNLPGVTNLSAHIKQIVVDKERNEAATKIQACYRGYIVRRTIKEIKKERESFKRRQRTCYSKQSLLTPDSEKDNHNKAFVTLKMPPNVEDGREATSSELGKKYPQFVLQEPSLEPYPFNFLQAVKKKLSMSFQSKKKLTTVVPTLPSPTSELLPSFKSNVPEEEKEIEMVPSGTSESESRTKEDSQKLEPQEECKYESDFEESDVSMGPLSDSEMVLNEFDESNHSKRSLTGQFYPVPEGSDGSSATSYNNIDASGLSQIIKLDFTSSTISSIKTEQVRAQSTSISSQLGKTETSSLVPPNLSLVRRKDVKVTSTPDPLKIAQHVKKDIKEKVRKVEKPTNEMESSTIHTSLPSHGSSINTASSLGVVASSKSKDLKEGSSSESIGSKSKARKHSKASSKSSDIRESISDEGSTSSKKSNTLSVDETKKTQQSVSRSVSASNVSSKRTGSVTSILNDVSEGTLSSASKRESRTADETEDKDTDDGAVEVYHTPRPLSSHETEGRVSTLPPSTALHLQFQAELKLLDSVEESLRRLTEIDKVRAVTRAEQESTALAQTIQGMKQMHNEELQAIHKRTNADRLEMEKAFEREQEKVEKLLEEVRRNICCTKYDSLEIVKTQAEAAKLTAEAAKKLSEAKTISPQEIQAISTQNAAAAAIAAVQEAVKLLQAQQMKSDEASESPDERSQATTYHSVQKSSSETSLSISHMALSQELRKGSQHADDETTASEDIEEQIPTVTYSRGSKNVPEVLGIVENLEQSLLSVERTVSEHLENNSQDQVSSVQSLTEELSEHESADYSSKFDSLTEEESKNKISSRHDKVESISGSKGSTGVSQRIKQIYQDSDSSLNDVPSIGSPQPKDSFSMSLLPSHSKYSLKMIQHLIKEEEQRSHHQKALLKLREDTLIEKARAELTWLDVQRKQLKEKGREDLIPPLKKKQRGILLKLQQEKEDIQRLRKAQDMAAEERRFMLLQQHQIVKMRMSTKEIRHKLKANNERPRKHGGPHKATETLNLKALKERIGYNKEKSGTRKAEHNTPTDDSLSAGSSIAFGDMVMASVSDSTAKSGLSLAKKSYRSESGAESGASNRKETEPLQCLEEEVLRWLEQLEKNKEYLSEREKNLILQRQSVEQQLERWKKLEQEEQKIKQIESEANAARAEYMLLMEKPIPYLLKDRSTSPLRFSEDGNSLKESQSCKVETKSKDSNVVASSDQPLQSSESIPEDMLEDGMKPSQSTIDMSTSGSRIIDQYGDSCESTESILTPKDSQPESRGSSGNRESAENVSSNHKKLEVSGSTADSARKALGVTIKVPLSPRVQGKQKRRHSSGSDESIVLSQTETASEQSDMEGRISALQEQLRRRKLEAERLRREQKRCHRERLKTKEQSLLKQIQAYDTYIQQARQELEQEFELSTMTIVKPQIKQPRVAEKSSARKYEEQKASVTTDGSSEASVSVSAGEGVQTDSKTLNKTSSQVSSIKDDVTEKYVSDEQSQDSSQKSLSQGSSLETTVESPKKLSSIVSEIESRDTKENELERNDLNSTFIVHHDDTEGESNVFSQNEDPATSSIINEDISEQISVHSHSRTDTIIEQIQADEVVQKDATYSENSRSQAEVVVQENRTLPTNIEESIQELIHTEEYQDAEKNETPDQNTESLKYSEDFTSTSLASIHSITSVALEDKPLDSQDDCTVIDAQAEDKITDKALIVDKITNDIFSQLLTESVTAFRNTVNVKQTLVLHLEETLELHSNAERELNKTFLVEEESSQAEISAAEKNRIVEENEISKSIEKEGLTNGLIATLLKEASSEIVGIYKKKRDELALSTSCQIGRLLEEMGDGDKSVDLMQNRGVSVRQRVHEILAETTRSPQSEKSRPQDFMVTTYGVLSSEETSSSTPSGGSPVAIGVLSEADIELSLNSPENEVADENKQKVEFSVGLSTVGESEGTDNEGFTQEWFDDDFGLTSRRREAEELRLQQLQIEQEIQQLQQAQEQYPYYIVREIPNKPPPPYTPPGQASRSPQSSAPSSALRIPLSKVDITRISNEVFRAVPKDQSDILALVNSAIESLYSAKSEGRDISGLKPPPNYYSESDDEEDIQNRSKRVFKQFLFDLTKQLVEEAYSCESEHTLPSWMKPLSLKRKPFMFPKSKETLQSIVERQVLVFFGFVPKAQKENLIIRWSRKKRDQVDELLVRELQEEEKEWTNYDEDEVAVKDQVASAIMDNLLTETVQMMSEIFKKRQAMEVVER